MLLVAVSPPASAIVTWNVLDFVHEVPGCETAATVTSGCVQRLGKRVDVRIYAYGHYQREKVLQGQDLPRDPPGRS